MPQSREQLEANEHQTLAPYAHAVPIPAGAPFPSRPTNGAPITSVTAIASPIPEPFAGWNTKRRCS